MESKRIHAKLYATQQTQIAIPICIEAFKVDDEVSTASVAAGLLRAAVVLSCFLTPRTIPKNLIVKSLRYAKYRNEAGWQKVARVGRGSPRFIDKIVLIYYLTQIVLSRSAKDHYGCDKMGGRLCSAHRRFEACRIVRKRRADFCSHDRTLAARGRCR